MSEQIRFCAAFLLCTLLMALPVGVRAEGGKPKVLFATCSGWQPVDCRYRQDLMSAGYHVGVGYYESMSPISANVLVVSMTSPDSYPFKNSDNARKVLDFVRNGGGLLLMTGYSGYGDFSPIISSTNGFLQPLGAQLVWEKVSDDSNKEVFSWSMDYTYYSTDNISAGPDHDAITRGVKRIWYPGGMHPTHVTAYTMTCSSDWDVLVRGMQTAHCASVASQPALLAVRSYGQGRIAIASWDPRYCISDGMHPAYGGYMLEKADCAALLANLYDWLGAPSVKAGKVFDTNDASSCDAQPKVQTPAPDFTDAALIKRVDAIDPQKVYKGIVGVRSEVSGATTSVEAYCKEARANGLDFLVFTEPYEKMDANKWGQLVQQCQEQTSGSFIAIPGLRISGAASGERIVYNLPRFPTADEVGDSWNFLLFNLGWPTVIVTRPHLNKMSPWQLKFYAGLALYTYENSKLVDDAADDYRELTGTDYRLVPVAVDDIATIDGLRSALTRSITYTNADSVGAILASMQSPYGSGSSWVSNGPVINQFTMLGGREPGYKLLFKIHVTSSKPLGEVTIYRGKTVFRRFYPNSTDFATYAWANSDCNGTYTLTARDKAGREAVSNNLRIQNTSFNYTMCVDKQNSIINTNTTCVDKDNNVLIAATGIIPSGFISGADVGAMWIIAPPEKMAPFGEDVTWCSINSIETGPQFYFKAGGAAPDIRRATCLRRKGDLSTSEALRSTNYYEDDYSKATVHYTMFRPKLYGNNAILVDSRITLKKPIALGDRQGGPEVVLFRAMTNTATRLYTDYSLIRRDGKISGGKIDSITTKSGYIPTVNAALTKGECFALSPNRVGNFAIFPLDGQSYTVSSGVSNDGLHSFVSGANPYRNYIELGFEWPKKAMAAGTVIDCRYLIVLDNGNTTPMTNFDLIRKTCGLSASPAYKVRVTGGKVLDRDYILNLKAANNAIKVAIGKAATPDSQLPVTVSGLNDNWDAGICDQSTKTIRRVAVFNGAAYTLFDTSKANNVVIGNLLTSDNPDVKLTLQSVGSRRAVALIHNPTPKPIACKVRYIFSGKEQKLTVNPGQTIEKRFSAASP